MSGLVAAFARLHERAPDHPSIHVAATGRTLTRDDVWQAHRRLAESLRAAGLTDGQLLVTVLPNRPELVPFLLAARASRCALLPLDAGTTRAETQHAAERFGAAAIVTADESHAPAGGMALGEGLYLERCDPREGCRDYGDTAILKVTSGTTGVPKAARTTDSHLIDDSEHIVAAMGIGPDDTQVAVIPLSHAYGLSVILVPLLIQGTPMVLREAFVPQRLPHEARAFRATTFAGVPYMFDYFVANPPEDGWPPQLRRLISAGARLMPETVRAFRARFGIKIHTFYGASEAGGISYDGGDEVTGEETVGTPLPGVRLTFRADDDTPAGLGRVHVASSGVADGYVGGPAADFVDGGFLTGDYGRLDSSGRLVLAGRVSAFINVAGKKVQPAEVEDVLRGMPGVRDVRVMGAADPQRGEQVVACLVAEPGGEDGISPLAVRRYCSSRLAPHKIPRTVVRLDAIPLTPRGKTDRSALDAHVRAAIAGIPEQMC